MTFILIMMMIRKIVVLLSVASMLSVSTRADNRNNGNIAYTLTKGYLESHQEVFQRYLVKTTEEMTLRDVRFQTKIEKGRLTSLMSNVQLSEMNLEQAHFTVDLIS